MTNDHTVPQAYLRRFAVTRRGGKFIAATLADEPNEVFQTNVRNVAAVNGFYWGTGCKGEPQHDMERFLGRIETAAIPAFSAILDDHHYALPLNWPLIPDLRSRLAWWMAAQILRTTRQRQRLGHLLVAAGEVDPDPGFTDSPAMRNLHNDFITHQIRPLASILFSRPWGIGFADVCLTTSDVPAMILNELDAFDQLEAAALWDIILPLDPHRFLLLPGLDLMLDPGKRKDHRLKLDGGMGIFLSVAIRDAAERHVFPHPEHPPHQGSGVPAEGPRQPRLWAADVKSSGAQYVISYDTLAPTLTVERRWIENPAPHRGDSVPTK